MNRHRFVARGRLTNYEMKDLREQHVGRDRTWIYPWSSLADTFHPHSLEEWDAREEI
jgi:hypothetical protein